MNLNMVRSGDKIFVNLDFGDFVTWYQANQQTLVRGTNLTLGTIKSEAEQAAVMSIISDKAWIGLRQLGIAEPDGGWTWVDGTPIVVIHPDRNPDIGYSNWGSGEPNNSNWIEHWGEIALSGFWNDMPMDVAANTAAIYEVSALTGFKLNGTLGTDKILGGDGADTLLARSGNDTILAGAGDDSISGGLGNNQIEGGLGNDTISSGGGSDTITGGAGADLLMAGSGADVFVYEEASESSRSAMDTIRYFNDAADVIDFTALSETLHLSDTTRFHNEAGEIVLRQQETRLLVLLDIDGDGQADLALRLGGTHALSDANFLVPAEVLA